VYLIDKAFFVVDRVVDLLVEQVTHPAAKGLSHNRRANPVALALYREGRRAFGQEQWEAFLESSNELMRARDRLDTTTPVDSFFRMVDSLRLSGPASRVDEILGLLKQARPHADTFRARLLDDPTMIPALDPLIPAIVQTVVHWGEGGTPVSIVHDRQNALTEERIGQLKGLFSGPDPALPGTSPNGRLTSLRLVDSRSDARVQIADILAGVARKIASDALNERGDAQLTALLRPYVDAFSIWGDDRSWFLLGPTSSAQSG
jgi:hypothetical protein